MSADEKKKKAVVITEDNKVEEQVASTEVTETTSEEFKMPTVHVGKLPDLNEMEEMYSLVCEYFKPKEVGLIERYWYAGMTHATFNKKDGKGNKTKEEKPAVILIDNNRKSFISSTFSLVSNLSKIDISNGAVPVQITYTGSESTKDAAGDPIKVDKFDIVQLSPKNS